MNPEIISRIADAFDTNLRSYLGDRYDDVITWNKVEPRTDICHSGDVCDSNVFMGEAFQTVFGRSDY